MWSFKKKGGNGWADEDDFSWRGTWWNYASNNWKDYSSYFDRWAWSYASAEKKRELKQLFKTKSYEAMTPIDIKVTSQPTEFFKKRRMSINIKEDELSLYNKPTVVDKIIQLYEKVPFNSDLIDSSIIDYLAVGKTQVVHYRKDWLDEQELIKEINDYDKGIITYSDLRKLFKSFRSEQLKCNIGWDSDNIYKWWWTVWSKVVFRDRNLYNRNLRIIQSKIKLRDFTTNEESLRRGKKINRNFINWTSYKPLISKTVEWQKKKKLFFILDCSWSMGSSTNVSDPSHQAISFAAACINSWVFDCSHIIYHSDSWWENCIKQIKKWELFNLSGCSEGFEKIEDNLEKDWLNWVDYIVTLTDLCIGSNAQQWLYDYLSKGKRHLIMSFKNKWTIKGMNVRTIAKSSDLINSLTTLVW